ncbi:sensor histidine kinase [Tenacibaculum sp. 190524A02b]|uniref:sensor histidine kinase n=1 Tax=Tenacibaculum vairaonense TaxID=3137860 RepID=UPI0031FAFF43
MDTKFSKTDYIILAIFYTVSVIINILDYYEDNEDLIEYLIDIPMFVSTSFIGVIVFMHFIIPSFLIKQKKYIPFTLWSLLTIVTIGIIERFTGFLSSGQDWSKFPTTFNLILYSIFNGSDSIGLPLGILVTKKFYESQTQISNIQKQQKENELKLLRSQIDPHFLFNNLNTLDSLIDIDTEKAKEYINKLSSTYRYLIKTKDSEVMELNEELSFAKNYIFLIKTRFANDYLFNIDILSSVNNKFIPTGAIQTLLENVVKHNIPNKNSSINTFIKVEENYLSVENQKSNQPSKKESLGTGLNNLKTRYELLSDQKVIIINTETSFSVTIPIIKLSS